MRPVLAVVTAVGASQWIPVNYLGIAYALAVAIIPDAATATLAATVQYTYDELGSTPNQDATGIRPISWTRSGTTLTVTDTGPFGLGHGLSTNDSVILTGTQNTNLDSPKVALPQHGDLGWTVTVTSPTVYTATVTNAGGTAGQGYAVGLRVHASTVTVATAVRGDGTLINPVQAVRLIVATLTGGNVQLRVTQGMGH